MSSKEPCFLRFADFDNAFDRVDCQAVSVNTTSAPSATNGLTLGVKLCRRPSYQAYWVRDMVSVGIRVRFRPKKMNWPVADGEDVVFTVTLSQVSISNC